MSGTFAWHHSKYPYGFSHCCSKQLGSALRLYAEDHGGKFPSGGKTPEGSLAMLYPEYAGAYLLRGKTIDLQTTEQMLKKQKTLTPESCGWLYVEGLTVNDDPKLAIAWDKVGLGHNGQRLRSGGHEVLYLDGSSDLVSGPEWPAFLERQKKLIERRTDRAKAGLPALTARIKLPDGTVVDAFSGAYTLRHSRTELSGDVSTGEESGSHFNPGWNLFGEADGHVDYVLTFPSQGLRSRPVRVEFRDGNPATNTIIFEMEKF